MTIATSRQAARFDRRSWRKGEVVARDIDRQIRRAAAAIRRLAPRLDRLNRQGTAWHLSYLFSGNFGSACNAAAPE